MTEQQPEQGIFDIDAWLDEAAPPQRSVTVYGRADLVAQLEDLIADRDKAARAASTPRPAAHGPIDNRLGGDLIAETEDDETLRALDDEIAEMRRRIADSALTLHVRAVLNAERDALLEEHTSKAKVNGREVEEFDRDGYEHAVFAAVLVDPVLTKEQAARLHRTIGEAQWASIARALEGASSETIDVPLSRLG